MILSLLKNSTSISVKKKKQETCWQKLASYLPLKKFCYGWLHRRLLRRYRPQSAVNCSTLWERAAGSPPNTSQVSLISMGHRTEANNIMDSKLYQSHAGWLTQAQTKQTNSCPLYNLILLGHRSGANHILELKAVPKNVDCAKHNKQSTSTTKGSWSIHMTEVQLKHTSQTADLFWESALVEQIEQKWNIGVTDVCPQVCAMVSVKSFTRLKLKPDWRQIC